MEKEPTDLHRWLNEETGRAASLARALDVAPVNINRWKSPDFYVPPGRCWQIELITGIKCERLNPTVEWVRSRKGGPATFKPKSKSRPARMAAAA